MLKRIVVCWAVLVLAWAGVPPGSKLRVQQEEGHPTFFLAIAAPPSAAAVVKAFNKTIANVSSSFLAGDYPMHLRKNITLQPLYIELPENERFSSYLLERTCAALSSRRVAAALVLGATPAAVAVTLAAARAGVPVMRAANAPTHFRQSIGSDIHPLEVRLEVTARETLHSVRALLLHTHWHTFTILAEADISSTLSLRKELYSIISSPPLVPTLLSLPAKYTRSRLFRRLADVSRSTRGVIVLICDIYYTQKVMAEAKRLNMLDGHFVWLWIDATQKIDVFYNIGNKTQYGSDASDVARTRGKPNDITVDRRKRNDPQKDKTAENYFNKSHRAKLEEKIENELLGSSDSTSAQMNYIDDKIDKNSYLNIVNKSEFSLDNNAVNIKNGKFISNIVSVDVNSKSLYENYDSKNKLYVQKEGVESSKLNYMKIQIEPTNSPDNSYSENSNKEEMDIVNNYMYRNEYMSKNIGGDFMDVNSRPWAGRMYSDVLFSELNEEYDSFPEELGVNSKAPSKRTARLLNFNKLSELDSSVAGDRAMNISAIFNSLPVGLLALKPIPIKTEARAARGAARLLVGALRRVLGACDEWAARAQLHEDAAASCWLEPAHAVQHFAAEYVRELRMSVSATMAGGTERPDRALTAAFEVLNLSQDDAGTSTGSGRWRVAGRVIGRSVRLDTIVWPGGDIMVAGLSARARSVFRVVTALAPPFVIKGELDESGQCLRGLHCHQVLTADKDNLTLVFNEMETQERLEDEVEDELQQQGSFFPTLKQNLNFHSPSGHFFEFQNKYKYETHCCYGLAMDLLENVAAELEFDFHLYIVHDGLHGTRKFNKKYRRTWHYNKWMKSSTLRGKPNYRIEYRNGFTENVQLLEDPTASEAEEDSSEPSEKWNGVVGDLVSGAAHMSFAALSVSSARAEVVDFSAPFFFSGVSFLAAPTQKSEIPLLAFLLPFSPELWIAIFTSLNVTAIAVAIYEWHSPFGLNPWGRQRLKNFSMSSALWVMWGLLCGHLVAFKAPKSWPNKFLINVWGGFSVIFVASYTANIAALIAGLFFHSAVDNYHDRSLLSQRVGAPRASAAESYVQRANLVLWDHIKKYALDNVEDGIRRLRNGSLDLLIADTPILDYYRATDHGCKLQRIGDTINEDTYAVGMSKGFPLKDSISALISKYSSNGYMDILQEKWYGGLPCFKLTTDYGIQPRPLGVAAVAGVFILLGVGMLVGCLILLIEHLFYKYTLPILRHKPKGTIWRSRNIMFFSQKLYRFINCVELVSPHHAARELVHTLRQGQITSLFQKSVKRKEHEQRRRRKSKAQFFEMIQEVRRAQQKEKDLPLHPIKEDNQKSSNGSPIDDKSIVVMKKNNFLSFSPSENKSRSPVSAKLFSKDIFRSPRSKNAKRKSVGGLNVRRFSTDSIFNSKESSSNSKFEQTSLNIGRRLSKDTSCLTGSPPDINSRRSSYLDFSKLGSQGESLISSESPLPSKEIATIPKYKGRKKLDLSPKAGPRKKRSTLFGAFGADESGESKSILNISIQGSSSDVGGVDISYSASELRDSDIHKRNCSINMESEMKVDSYKLPVRRCFSQQTERTQNIPNIKIQIEDHSEDEDAKQSSDRVRSLNIASDHSSGRSPIILKVTSPGRRCSDRLRGHSPVSDSSDSKDNGKANRRVESDSHEISQFNDCLPPAPPYPNVSPRNSNGISPLSRLSKEELVLLWRSSESELRSHLLVAIREKKNMEPP